MNEENDEKRKNKKTPLIEEDEDSYGKSDKSDGGFDEGKLQVNINSMGQIIEERKEMIKDFKNISSQVNDLSKSVMIELQKQGEHVTRLEDHANVINKNAKNVKSETNETNVINEKNIRKSIWIIVGLVIILLILIGIFRML